MYRKHGLLEPLVWKKITQSECIFNVSFRLIVKSHVYINIHRQDNIFIQ